MTQFGLCKKVMNDPELCVAQQQQKVSKQSRKYVEHESHHITFGITQNTTHKAFFHFAHRSERPIEGERSTKPRYVKTQCIQIRKLLLNRKTSESYWRLPNRLDFIENKTKKNRFCPSPIWKKNSKKNEIFKTVLINK
jgi:hypothetical protein